MTILLMLCARSINDFPQDTDVVALFCEAMMTRTPWKLWNIQTGEVAEKADTVEVIQVLEKAMKMIDQKGFGAHPGVHHLYIHVLENVSTS